MTFALLSRGVRGWREIPPTWPAFQRKSSSIGVSEESTILSKPSWSVKSLIPTASQLEDSPRVSSKELHHLLRLSALNPPKTEDEEEKMITTLSAQLHFVRQIQSVNTDGIDPLTSIRDETIESEKENAITFESLKGAFAKEETKGKRKRIQKRKDLPIEAKPDEDWDVLEQSSRSLGRFFVVNCEKEETVETNTKTDIKASNTLD
ncbi:MAG: hypothetical protein M1829_006788 [Trizodia sp. TS-e1964]|nr:MAG: hypothetical protein M1829_006788 [Trizodia sp. TS-e1964]